MEYVSDRVKILKSDHLAFDTPFSMKGILLELQHEGYQMPALVEAYWQLMFEAGKSLKSPDKQNPLSASYLWDAVRDVVGYENFKKSPTEENCHIHLSNFCEPERYEENCHIQKVSGPR